MSNTALGLIAGLALGFAFVFGSFGDGLIVALCGAIGLLVAKVIDGDVDLGQYLGGRDRRTP